MPDSPFYDAAMSDSSPRDDDPFGGIPFLEGLFESLQGIGSNDPQNARRIAGAIANEGRAEPNVDPVDRRAVTELVRIAELHVAGASGLTVARGSSLQVEVLNRTQWADRTVDDYQTLLASLSGSLTAAMRDPDADSAEIADIDPMAAMLKGLSELLAPMLSTMTTASMVGNLAGRALGGYELPVPRAAGSGADGVLILLPNVDRFADDWSLDRSDVRLWAALHEVAHHAVLGVAGVAERISGLLTRHASSFESDSAVLGSLFDDLDLSGPMSGLGDLQARLGDPETLLGAVRSTEQAAIAPELKALTAAVSGYVDHVMDRIGAGLIGSYAKLSEAMRRRRVQANGNDRFVERLLGFELGADTYDLGTAFVSGVLERAGDEGLTRLFADASHLPTPAEISAPGLWLARIDLPD